MTSSKALIKAVTDGTTTEPTDGKIGIRPEHGIARVRQDHVYYTAGLARSALYEAEQITQDVQHTAATLRMPSDTSVPLDMADVLAAVGEALDCIDVASESLSALCTDIRLRLADEEP